MQKGLPDTTGDASDAPGAHGTPGGQAREAVAEVQRTGSWRGRLPWAVALIVTGVGLYFAFLPISLTYNVNSDGSGIALQGWDMLHGNLLLRGWWTADVSFYTFETPVDALVEAVRGLNPMVVHTTAAIAYALLVIMAAMAARGTTRGGAGVAAAVIAAAVLLVPGDIMSTSILLGSPDHIGVGVVILLTYWFIDRAPERWWVAPVACLLLVWAQLDDPMAEFAAAFALAVVGLGRACAGLLRRRGWAAVRHDAALGAAGVASYLLTRLAIFLIRSAGGYSMVQLSQATKVQPLSAWPGQVVILGKDILILFGADFYDEPNPMVRATTYLHLLGLALAAAGLVAGIVVLFRVTRGDRITQVLTVGTLVTLVAGAFLSPLTAGYAAHEIAVVLPFGAVLAGRAAGPWLMRQRVRRGTLIPVGIVLAAASLASIAYFADQPPLTPPTRVTVLDRWLEAHHLTDGLGQYWTGAGSRVDSGGRLRISPTVNSPARPYAWIMKPSWFDQSQHTANFVVAGTDPAGGLVYSESTVRHAFGKPAREYRFGQGKNRFIIMVYNRNLLRDVAKPVQSNPDTGGLHL